MVLIRAGGESVCIQKHQLPCLLCRVGSLHLLLSCLRAGAMLWCMAGGQIGAAAAGSSEVGEIYLLVEAACIIL